MTEPVRRVVVLGAESTGSTTLARALAEHFSCPYVPEYGRDYTWERPGTIHTPWKTVEFEHIADVQNQLEDAAARDTGNGWVICDTDAFSTVLWHERYMGFYAPTVQAISDQQARPFARILTGDDIPFEQDGIRDGEAIRHAMQARFREELRKTDVPWIEVRGSVAQRLADSLAFLDQLRADRNLSTG